MIALRIMLFGALSALTLAASDVQEELSRLLALRLDPAACYRVRDLFLERDDVKLYFTDGYLIFADPVRGGVGDGREVTALFLADKPSDQGEILLIPPNPQERESLTRHIGDAVLNQKFRSALMLFTDDTARLLRDDIAAGASAVPDPERGAILAKNWSPVLRNILEGVSLRLLADLTAEVPEKQGFFAAAIGGGPKGRFDVLVDPRAVEQMWVGQMTWRDGRRNYDTWCEFEGRTFREGLRERVEFGATVETYRIEADLLDDLSMQATAGLDVVVEDAGRGSLAFEISRQLEVTAARVNGESAAFLQLSQAAAEADRQRNTLVLLSLGERPEKGARFLVEFEYRGKVIDQAGNGVYRVGSRGSWYPRGPFEFSRFELAFHHPPELDVVATGELISQVDEAGRRTSRFRAPHPIRVAGFNVGSFVSTSREWDGYRVEVRANRLAEDRLQRPVAPVMILDPTRFGGRRSTDRTRPMIVSPDRPVIRPADRIEQVADEAVAAFRFLLEKLGPPPMSQVAVTPIPGFFGQGFPGLVYASTLSYLDELQPPLSEMSESNRFFYRRILLPHELSHQWWGNLVSVDNTADGWMLEALATYTSLLYIERTQGAAELDKVLRWYRDDLLRKTEAGAAVDAEGPIAMGERLRSAEASSAYQVIVYEKGAWIFHMLRRAMGDESFERFLRSLPERFAFQALNNRKLQEAAAEFLPAGARDPELEDFFDQWVYHTGIPRFSSRWKQNGDQVEITLRQSEVPERFVYAVTIEIEIGPGRSVRREIVTEGASTTVRVKTPGQATGVRIDPDGALLALVD